MRNPIGLTMLACVCLGVGWAAGAAVSKPSTFVDGQYGYTLTTPRYAAIKPNPSTMTATFYAPVEDSFAANIGVMIQQVRMTREEYRKISLDGFKQANYKVNTERDRKVSGKDAILWDYEGPLQGRDYRYLALAVIGADRVYLVTGTAPKESFSKYEREFRACLDSFRLTP